MQAFRLYHPLWMSFYSKALYRDVAQRWSGNGLRYILLLVLVGSALPLIQLHLSATRWANAPGQAYVQQLPTIIIKRGQLSVDPPGDRLISDPDTGKPVMLIKLDGSAADLESIGEGVLLTRTQVMRRSGVETRIWELRDIEDLTLTPAEIGHLLRIFANLLSLILLPIGFLGSLLYRQIQAWIYAAIGLVFTRIVKVKLDYRTLVRLSAVAMTPAVLLNALCILLPFQVPMRPLFSFLLSIGYLHFGVRANRTQQP